MATSLPTAALAQNADRGTKWCVECEDVAASVRCDGCGGDYMCGLCFQWQHRSGRRALHKPTPLPGMQMLHEDATEGTTQHFIKLQQQSSKMLPPQSAPDSAAQAEEQTRESSSSGTKPTPGGALRARLLLSAQWIPVRISPQDRVYLRLLEGALEVSEYTDKVDVVRGWGWRNSKQDTIRDQISDLLQLLLGLVVAGNYKEGTNLVSGGDMQQNAAFFQKVLEIGRRFKITNPEKMRCTYGKLIYLLQDSPSAMDFSLKGDIKTVHSVLEEKGGLEMLEDEDAVVAIDAVSNAVNYAQAPASREQVEQRGAAKQAAIERLCKRYASPSLSVDDIQYCLASLSDFNSFIDSNRRPVDDMLILLKSFFDPSAPEVLCVREREREREVLCV